MSLSKRIRSVSPSPTFAITVKANKMKAEGINVIGFGAGEPGFIEAGRQIIAGGGGIKIYRPLS